MPGLLNAAQLAAFRASATAALDLSGVTQKRPARTANAWGGFTESETTIATGLAAAWAKPSAAVMQQYAGLIGALKSWVVRLPYGAAIQRDDLLVMPSGDTLKVQADLTERSYAACVRVLATEVV